MIYRQQNADNVLTHNTHENKRWTNNPSKEYKQANHRGANRQTKRRLSQVAREMQSKIIRYHFMPIRWEDLFFN